MTEFRDSSSKSYHKFQIDISDYTILNQIESGGFGLVYVVQNKKTKCNCAAKVLNTHNDESQYKKMINREIGIMIRCQHPTIIKFIGYSFYDFNHQKNVTIFMDLAKKGSLAELLNKSQSGLLDEIVDNTIKQIILVGIARGMMILHQHQIIHRDLKPGNILLDNEYRPHITDFGLSKFYETGRSMIQSQQCGTSIYMAPEIIEGNRYNGKVDIYSFGILMYEVVTNSIPYPNLINGKMTTFSFNKKVVDEDLRPTFEFPINKSIQKLIESCWSKDPKERPTFEEIFKKLAYNIDDLVDNIYEDYDYVDNDSNENNYYLDGVDVNEVIAYANDIDNPDHPIKEEEEEKSINNLIEKLINPIIKENKEIKNKIFAIQKEKNELQKELINVAQTSNNIKIENENMKNHINTIEREKNELKKELIDTIQKTNDIKTENDIIKQQISYVQDENKKLQNDLSFANQKNNIFVQENIEIKKQMTLIQTENQELKKKLDESFQKTINIQNEITDIKKQINDTQEKLNYVTVPREKDDENSLSSNEKTKKKHKKSHKNENNKKSNDDTDSDLSDKSSNKQEDNIKRRNSKHFLFGKKKKSDDAIDVQSSKERNQKSDQKSDEKSSKERNQKSDKKSDEKSSKERNQKSDQKSDEKSSKERNQKLDKKSDEKSLKDENQKSYQKSDTQSYGKEQSKMELDKNDILIYDFNNMPLQTQQISISEIKNEKLSEYYRNINNLLLYLLSFNISVLGKYFKITPKFKNDSLMTIQEEHQIVISSRIIEVL